MWNKYLRNFKIWYLLRLFCGCRHLGAQNEAPWKLNTKHGKENNDERKKRGEVVDVHSPSLNLWFKELQESLDWGKNLHELESTFKDLQSWHQGIIYDAYIWQRHHVYGKYMEFISKKWHIGHNRLPILKYMGVILIA